MGPKVTPETFRTAVEAIVPVQTGTEVDPEVLEVIKETYRSAVANAEVSEVTPETFRTAVEAIVPVQTGTEVDPEVLEVIKETYRSAVAGAEIPKELGSGVEVPE